MCFLCNNQEYECSEETRISDPGGGGRLTGTLWNLVRIEPAPRTTKDTRSFAPRISRRGGHFGCLGCEAGMLKSGIFRSWNLLPLDV